MFKIKKRINRMKLVCFNLPYVSKRDGNLKFAAIENNTLCQLNY